MLAILATLAASVTAVLAQADDSAIVSKLLTANTQVAKVADITPVRIALFSLSRTVC
jgi:hypothetical protein